MWEQAELSLYEELWDAARTLTESEAKPLAKIYKDKEVEGTFIHFLKDHHRCVCRLAFSRSKKIYFRKPLTLDEGKSIYSHQWGEILFHLNKIVSRARFLGRLILNKVFLINIYDIPLFQLDGELRNQEVAGAVHHAGGRPGALRGGGEVHGAGDG